MTVDVFCGPRLPASRTCSTATTATGRSPTSPRRPASPTPATTASACCSPTSTTTAGPTSTSRTIRCRIFSSATIATARSPRRGSQAGVAVSGDGKAQAGMGVDAGDYERRRPPRRGRHELLARLQHPLREQRGGSSPTSATHRARRGRGPVPGLGRRVRRLRQRRPARRVRRQRPRVSGHRRSAWARATCSEAGVPEPGTSASATSPTTSAAGCCSRNRAAAQRSATRQRRRHRRVVLNMDDRPTLSGTTRRAATTGSRCGSTDEEQSRRHRRARREAGGRRQRAEVRGDGSYLSHNDMRAHFGLGEARRDD